MEERIQARITELEQAERKTEMELIAIRTVLTELRKLLSPDAPEVSGDPLGESQP
jgi:hypothetical protein